MSNPFKNTNDRDEIYLEFVRKQVSPLDVGESIKVNFTPKDAYSFRMCLSKIAIKAGLKFRTKIDSKSNLWVKRIK